MCGVAVVLVEPRVEAVFGVGQRASHTDNIELAAPDDFVPVPAGWESRSRFVAQEGPLTFLHYDFVAQALSKIERGHRQDLDDVRQMLERGLTTAESIQQAFDAVLPFVHRYPAIDVDTFRRAVAAVVSGAGQRSERE